MKSKLNIFLTLVLPIGFLQPAQAITGGCPIDGATPMNIGPLNPQNGFPLYVQDSTGLTVEICLNPNLCIFDPPIDDPTVPGFDFSQQIGFGGEGFWASAANAIITTNGLNARLVSGVEAAFNTETPIDGDQFPFTRLRIRIDAPLPGIYTVTHPWGREVYTIETLEAGDEVFESFDISFAANTNGYQGRIGPILHWDTGFPIVVNDINNPNDPNNGSYLGDPATPHTVTGSPCGTNFFRIEAVALDGVTPLAIDPDNIDGDGNASSVQTGLFNVSGKIFSGEAPAPLIVDRTSYARDTVSANGRVDTFATSSPTSEITLLADIVNGLWVDTPLLNEPLIDFLQGLFFKSIAVADASLLPESVQVRATNAAAFNVDAIHSSPLTDSVNITRAEYDISAQTLTIEANSSDRTENPLLEALTFGTLSNGVQTFNNVLAPPAKVTVTSAKGGTDSEDITIVP